jgi:hypothetical protein
MTATLALLFGCGGSGSGAEDTGTAGSEAATPASGTDEATEQAADGTESALAGIDEYHTRHDPDAVYTYDDIPGRGNYIRVNFEGLTDEQVNHVIHRLRTEKCHCLDCAGITVDECLITRSECTTGEKMAVAIVSEEKRREE